MCSSYANLLHRKERRFCKKKSLKFHPIVCSHRLSKSKKGFPLKLNAPKIFDRVVVFHRLIDLMKIIHCVFICVALFHSLCKPSYGCHATAKNGDDAVETLQAGAVNSKRNWKILQSMVFFSSFLSCVPHCSSYLV